MLNIAKANPFEREITISSSIKDMPDREFVLRFDRKGITARRKGKTNDGMRITWKNLIGLLLIHHGE